MGAYCELAHHLLAAPHTSLEAPLESWTPRSTLIRLATACTTHRGAASPASLVSRSLNVLHPTGRTIKKPVITEKSTIQKETSNQLTFEVDRRANKVEIRRAVERIFNVKVIGVRTMQMRGKIKRFGRVLGKRSNWKKAIVTLAQGEHVEFFEGV